jgi:predicted DNA binding protein
VSQTSTDPGSPPDRATQLTLRVWHPNCWTLNSTSQVDAGLVVHGVYMTDGIASARLTAYADASEDIEELVTTVEESPLTDGVKRIYEYFNGNDHDHAAAGNATEELLVEYRSANSIHDAFVSRGFVPDDAIRIHGGEEYWTVISTQSRAEIRRRLDEVRREMDADIAVERMTSPSTGTTDDGMARLSERQREVFRLAKRRGYYEWPRKTSASDLADEMELSKTTLLEHLRKAEAKLLGSSD